MGRATSEGNEAKSKMKHPSDMLTPIFGTQVVVIYFIFLLISCRIYTILASLSVSVNLRG